MGIDAKYPDGIFHEVTKVTAEVIDNTNLLLIINTTDTNGRPWQVKFPKLSFDSADLSSETVYAKGRYFQSEICRSVTLKLFPTEDNALFTIRDMLPPKKMTVQQIQEQLGYQIEVIAGEE